MSEEHTTVADMMDQERDEAIRWYAATHSPEYESTIHAKANSILDDFGAAQQDPARLKEMVPALDSDYDRMNFARGVIWAFMQVIQWKFRAEVAHDEMRALDDEALSEREAEDVGPSFDDQWVANR